MVCSNLVFAALRLHEFPSRHTVPPRHDFRLPLTADRSRRLLAMMSVQRSPLTAHGPIAFIGGGNMARSLVGGLLRGGADAAALAVSEPNEELRAALARDFAIATHADNAAAARDAGALVLAVKPQVMKTVCAGLREIVQLR